MTDPVDVSSLVAPCPHARYVIEAQFLGEDNAPVANIAMALIAGRDRVQRGRTDRQGLIRFDGLAAGSYRISACDIDEDAWELLRAEPLAGSAAQGQGDAPWAAPQAQQARAGIVHVIAPGECTAKLAERYGLFPDTVWDHPDNAALNDLRKDKNILFAGDSGTPADRLYIPPLRIKTLPAPTGQRQVFKRRGIPEILRIRFMDEDAPRSDIPYLLSLSMLDGTPVQKISGRTDSAGSMVAYVPPGADSAELVLGDGDGDEQEFYELAIGHLDPLATDTGLAARLEHLGYAAEDAEHDPAVLAQALADFRADRGLPDDCTDQRTREEIALAYLS